MRSVRHTMGAVQTQVDPLFSAREEENSFDKKKHSFSDMSAWNNPTCQLHGAFMVMGEKNDIYSKITLFYSRALSTEEVKCKKNWQMDLITIPYV